VIRRLLDWVGYVPVPRRPPSLSDRGWAKYEEAAVLDRITLKRMSEMDRARLRKRVAVLRAEGDRLWAAADLAERVFGRTS
jgi:hypothetical protein